MSRYQQTQSSNPFDDDDDGDFVMVGNDKKPSKPNSSSVSSRPQQRSQNPYSSNSSWGNSESEEQNPFEDRWQQLHRQIENSENTQLESTQRALSSIYDSEAMGIATAEELVRQGETIDSIENKTDSMQHNLKTSQRHLNNIKSVFGGIKNWWSGDKKAADVSSKSESNANSRLRATIEATEKTKPDTSGFYDDDDDLNSRFMSGAKKSPPSSGSQYTMITPMTRSAREAEVDQNLALMCDGMSRLKGLAAGLGDEIERQNEQLDRVNSKVATTDDLLGNQNSQMRRILKK